MAFHLTDFYIVGDSDCYSYAILKLRWHLEQHIPEPTFFYFEAIRVWDLSAMPFHQSGAGCFFADSGLPSDPPIEGDNISSFFLELLDNMLAI